MGKLISVEDIIEDYFIGKSIFKINGKQTKKIIQRVKVKQFLSKNSYSVEFFSMNISNDQENITFDKEVFTLFFGEGESDKDIVYDDVEFSYDLSLSNQEDLTEEDKSFADIIEINSFSEGVDCLCFINDDGYGYPLLRGNKIVKNNFSVSELALLKYNPDVESVLWYNR